MQGYLLIHQRPGNTGPLEDRFEDLIDVLAADVNCNCLGDIHRTVAVNEVVTGLPGNFLEDF